MKLAEFFIILSGLIVFLATFIGIGYGLSKFQEKNPNLYFYLFVYSAIIYFTLPLFETHLPLLYEQILMAVFIPIVAHGLFNEEINNTLNIDTFLKNSSQST